MIVLAAVTEPVAILWAGSLFYRPRSEIHLHASRVAEALNEDTSRQSVCTSPPTFPKHRESTVANSRAQFLALFINAAILTFVLDFGLGK